MDLKLSLEYRDVSFRAEHLLASQLAPERIGRLLDTFEKLAEFVDVRLRHRPLSSDPNDDMVLDLAISGRADAIVTNNLKHFVEPAGRFHISVYLPSAFLKSIAKDILHGI